MSSPAIEHWRKDLARYRADGWLPPAWWISERTFWAVTVFRLGQWVLERKSAAVRIVLRAAYLPIYTLSLIVTNIEIPPEATIGPGLRIHHGGNIVINPAVRIGSGCLMRQGVTIGKGDRRNDACPTIGDGVELGAYAQVLGKVVVGSRVKVGAMTVVLNDVPDDAVVVGVPAREVQ